MIEKQRSESRTNLLNKLFTTFSIISFLEGLFVFGWIASIPTDPKNSVFLGYSLQRLILLATVLVGEIIFSIVFIQFSRRKMVKVTIYDWMKKPFTGRVSGLSGLALALIALVPVNEWGRWGAAFERVLPLVVWVCLLFLQCYLVVQIANGRLIGGVRDWTVIKIYQPRRIILSSIGILLIIYLLSVLLYPSASNEDYWYETGVPILLWQIITALVAGSLYIRFEKRILKKLGKRIDTIFFALIFLLSGLLWSFSPLSPSHFNPKPAPPNNVYYPFSDAQIFDLQAQSTLIGLGFDNGTPLDRPFYPLFLAVIHLISGQNYSDNMMLQAFLFGVFPAMVYLVCAEMGSRRWGLVTAIAIAFWGCDYILVNNVLNTSTPKQMLSDFPMLITLSLVLFFSIKWLKGGDRERIYAFITGGMIALSAYIRYSALPLLPFWIILAIVRFRSELKTGLISAVLLISGFLVVTMPWYARNISIRSDFYLPFSKKINFVIEQRYLLKEETPYNKDSDWDNDGNIETITPNSEESDRGEDDETRWGEGNRPGGNDLSKPFFNWFPPHLVHNILSSILILPSSLEIASLDTSLENGSEIWGQYWNGRLPFFRFLLILVEFFILSSGFVGIYQHDKTTAISVVLMFLGVNLANSLGRTSGGRYIVPVNWVVLLTYFAGILFLAGKLTFRQVENTTSLARAEHPGWRTWMSTVLAVLIVGALPVIFEKISLIVFAPQAEIHSTAELFSLAGNSISKQEIMEMDQFLEHKDAGIMQGYAFYPSRQLKSVSENIRNILNYDNEINLLSFSLLNPGNKYSSVFPYGGKIDLQNQDKVYLVVCKLPDVILIRNLVIVRGDTTQYYRSDYLFEGCDVNN